MPLGAAAAVADPARRTGACRPRYVFGGRGDRAPRGGAPPNFWPGLGACHH